MSEQRITGRVAALLFVALCATSCLRPSCIDRVFGLPNASPSAEHFATLTIYSEPTEAPLEEGPPAGAGFGDRYERGAFVTINAEGRMVVSMFDLWPRRCPTIPRNDLVAVSQRWQPVLQRIATAHADLRMMAAASTGRPGGPFLSLQFGPLSGKSLGVLWDGESTLPEDVETAVMATLEMMCSNSRLAKRYLLRDLPRPVGSRLECRETKDAVP